MKQKFSKTLRFHLFMVCGAIALTLPLSLHAVTHVVQFGGAVGLTYSPSSFSAAVHDTVRWNGDFSMHPLSSTTIPAGAATWHVTSGSAFSYVIRVAGTYHYQCDVHVSLGMTGTFTAAASAVLPGRGTTGNGATSVRIFSSAGRAVMRLNVQSDEVLSGTIFSIDGRKSAAIANTRLGPGDYTIPLQNMGPGAYIVHLFAGKQEIIKNVLVAI
jgi:plastocyanin